MQVFELLTSADERANVAFASDALAREVYPLFDGEPLRRPWRTARVVPADERVLARTLNDMCVWGTVPVFSSRAALALDRVLRAYGELLPLSSSAGELYAYNVTTMRNALVESESLVRRFTDGGIMSIERYVLDAAVIGEAAVFKIPQQRRSHVFVTDAFKTLVLESKLSGFEWRAIWP